MVHAEDKYSVYKVITVVNGVDYRGRARTFLAFVVAIIVLFCQPIITHAAKKITVGSFPFSPLISTDSEGVTCGINADIIEQIAKEHGWQIVYRSGSWNEGLLRAQNNEVDLLTSIIFTEDRGKYLDYTAEPIFTVWGGAYVLPSSKIKSLHDLRNRKIAIMEGDVNGLNFVELAQNFDLGCTFVEVPSHHDVFKLVQQRDVIAGIAPNIFGLLNTTKYQLVQTPIIFNPSSLYFAVPKGTNAEVISALDTTLVRWKKNEDSFYYKTLTHWLSAKELKREILPAWFFPLLIGVVGAVLFLFFWARLLKKQVQSRTQELIKKEQKLSSLYNSSPDMYVSISPDDASVLRCNNTLIAKLGLTRDEVIGQSVFNLYHPDSLNDAKNAFQQFTQTGNVTDWHLKLKLKDGSPLDVSLNASAVRDPAGEILYSNSSWRDISARIQAEKKYELLVQEASMGIVLADAETGEIVECNTAMATLVGRTRDELIGQSQSILHPEEHTEGQGVSQTFIRHQDDLFNELILTQCVTKSGQLLDVEIKSKSIFYNNKKMLLGIFQDVTERIKAEEKLKLSSEREKELADIVRMAPVAIAYGYPDGTLRNCNAAFSKLTQYSISELQQIDWNDVLTPDKWRESERESLSQLSPSHKSVQYEKEYIRKDGDIVSIELTVTANFDSAGNIINYIGFILDISARKALEGQLRQKYKMDSIGVMAGGMAHNFNNNLSIILGNISLSKMKLPKNSEIVDCLDNAKTAVLRSRDLIQQILTYSRQGIKDKTSIQLPLVIDETIQLLRSTYPSTINLHHKISTDSHTIVINADASQIQECLINLCNNSMHSMDEQGDLTIGLESVKLNTQDIPAQYECKPGHYAKISVQDCGCGMSAETVDKIFDLFFTTKAVDQGTGVGLSTVHGIVTQHDGFITVNSIVGQGTTFEIFLPVNDPSQRAKTAPLNTQRPKGTEKVLFIDDDEMLANLGELMLTETGYQVTAMTDSQEALKLFAANPLHFDLVITDQTMPQLTGKELVQKIKQIRPDIRTIICTGFSSKIDEESAKTIGADGFLMKPLDLPVLLQTMRQILDNKRV